MPEALYIVSNRLPVTISETGIEKSSGGLVAALEGMGNSERPMKWLGWPGKEVPPDQQNELSQKLNGEFGCDPVFFPAELAKDHYEGMSNSAIWPLFHYLPAYFRYQAEWWQAYQQVNQIFADKILATAKDGDLIWVHDYQLMLVPQMLKKAKPALRVGFFLHTPFPSYDIFRCLPHREEVLSGLLGADLIGFHTFGYLRHFRSNVLRLLGAESEMTTVRHQGRTTTLGVFPIGINAQRFEKELDTPAFAEKLAQTAAAHKGKRVILSIERLDYTKGILQRLEAIELFLKRLGPEERDRLKFIFISVPTRSGVDQYAELRQRVESRIGRINGANATVNNSPLHFIHGSVDFTELCALYALAEVALVTPLIDGMNLVAKEFIACQRETPADGVERPGVLVLSEFAGAAQELFNAITINPYDVPALADAIEQALNMSPADRRQRMRPMRERVFTYDAAAWAKDFVGDLAAMPVTRPFPVNGVARAREQLAQAISAGKKVALLLDYDGTLREVIKDPAAAALTPELRHLLDRLSKLKNVETTIVSGRTSEDLELFLGEYPSFGLVAEHGAAVRPPGGEWEQLDQNLDFGWKEQIERILHLYQRSTPGTHIEDKRTSLVWHYRRSDPEFGKWKANQLVDELSIVAANVPIEIRHGRKIVEVASAHINKGAAVSKLLAAGGPYEIILMAGDDATDESMFKAAPCPEKFITIRIGDGDTHARFRVATPANLRQFLEAALAG